MVVHVVAQVRPDELDRGREWLSWNQAQRNTYVNGFISGYLTGSLYACASADELFEVGQSHRLGDDHHPSDVPSARCLARRNNYSKCTYKGSSTDCSAYTKVITSFYKEHPENGKIPFPHLLIELGDEKCSTVDQLYELVKNGKIRSF
jgi:hypothetical protein